MRRRSPFRWIYSTILTLGFLAVMTGVSEWLIWVNADRYPQLLAHEYVVGSTDTHESIGRLMPVFEKLCGRPGGFAIVTKANGTFLRCNNSIAVFGWFDGVYLIH